MAQNVRPGRLDFTVVRQRVDPPASDRDRERSQVRVGDLLFTIVGASTGDVCPVVDELPGHYVCQSVALVRLCLPATQGWVLRYFLSAGAGRKLLDEVIYGQGRPHLGFDDLKRLPIPLAPLAEQTRAIHRIAAYEASTDAVTSKVEAAREELGLLDQAILSKAFRGELVSQDPDDEPASALLDRIRAERQAEGKGRSARSRQGRLAGLD